uniref:Putative aspartic proteinase-like protein 1 n=1 Tax=Davidia involucrata TaxID=16924 RepID=A0A5B7BU10_DAVIN
MRSFCVFLFISISIWGFQSCNGRIFSLEMHQRFSEPVKKWAKTAGKNFPAENWPVMGSIEYYAQLANHDRVLRGRRLSGFDGPLSFSDGNSTFRISSLGFLHYTTVSLGTPGMKFLVALDTGSDLFWVPCDCSSCAPTEDTPYNSDFELSIYNPNESSTSKKVTCTNSLCAHRNRCIGTFSHCPYMVSYVSSETSTSGILVEDVLHLKTEDIDQEFVEAYITFGCGQVQTGSFLDVAAPNGLFGLGMEKISVPSILSREGYTADSFSMCFGRDGTGRINFGDKGSLDQEETSLNVNPLHPTYNIAVTQTRIGTTLIDLDITALFDSGTSFTYLIDPLYTRLSESFHSQAQDRRRPPDPRIPFEYCYDMSPDANTSLIPTVSLTMKGGSQLAVYDPIIVISTQHELVYCLAVVKSAEINIIGQNFMSGYRIVFDREKLVLGWKKFDCYDIEDSNTFPTKPHNSTSTPPAVAVGLDNYHIPKSTKETRSNSHSSVASPFYRWHISDLTNSCFGFLFILFLLM